jgi:TatD DNase family protein
MTRGPWTDSHCHLQDLDDPPEALRRAVESGVGRIVCVGTGVDSSRRARAVARELGVASSVGSDWALGPELYATVGLHPHDASSGVEGVARLLEETMPGPGAERGLPGSTVGIGECGLDYHYDYSPRDVQREAFAAQVALAHQFELALVVHTRDAWHDTFAVLDAEGIPDRTIIHCFTGGPDEARRCLDAGAYLSFSGIATFKGAPEVREAVTLCPLDKMLVETDAPYLAPVPHRGRPNEPAYVPLVGALVAELKGVPVEEVAEATSAATATVFALRAPGHG